MREETTAAPTELPSERFNRFRESNPDASLADLIQGDSDINAESICQMIIWDIEFRAARQCSVSVQEFFDDFPILLDDKELAYKILLADAKCLLQTGHIVEASEYQTGAKQLDEIFFQNRTAHEEIAPPSSPRPSNRIEIGQTIGHYELVEKFNSGRRADVFKARDTNLSRWVVLKIVGPSIRISTQEAQFLAKLSHPNILPIHEAFESGLRQCIVTPFVDGITVAELIKYWHSDSNIELHRIPERLKKGKNSIARMTVELMLNVLPAARHAHNQGVLHCDIKPSNMMLEASGNALLMDFDVAIAFDSVKTVGGTTNYASPEQQGALTTATENSRRRIDHRSDIYSIGVVIYELLTGELPLSKSGSELRACLSKTNGMTPSLGSIVARCLQQTPDDRYQSVGELQEDLECWAQTKPLKYAPDHSWLEKIYRGFRRRPMLATAVLTCLVIMLVMVYSRIHDVNQVAKMLDRVEVDLASEEVIDAKRIANHLVDAQSVLGRSHPINFFLNEKRKSISSRLQVILWQLARKEDEQLIETSKARMRQEEWNANTNERETGWVKQFLTDKTRNLEDLSMIALAFAEVWNQSTDQKSNPPTNLSQNEKNEFMGAILPSLTEFERIQLTSDRITAKQLLETLNIQVLQQDNQIRQKNLSRHLRPIEWHVLGLRMNLSNDYKFANACFQKSIDDAFQKHEIPTLETLRYLVVGYLKTNHWKNAEKYLRLIVSLKPDNHAAANQLGLVLEKSYFQQATAKTRVEAERFLRTAARLAPENPNYFADLGGFYVRQRQPKLAIETLVKAAQLNSNRSDVSSNLSIAYYLSGDVDAAFQELAVAIKKFPEEKKLKKLLRMMESGSVGDGL